MKKGGEDSTEHLREVILLVTTILWVPKRVWLKLLHLILNFSRMVYAVTKWKMLAGWIPQTFTSSRKNRAEIKQQSILNFLDDDEKGVCYVLCCHLSGYTFFLGGRMLWFESLFSSITIILYLLELTPSTFKIQKQRNFQS